MLTLLSRSLRALLGRADERARAAAASAARLPSSEGAEGPAALLESASRAVATASAKPPRLRLVAAEDSARANHDIAIRDVVTGRRPAPGAAAFVAGAGARLYSLDAFRAARRPISPAPGPRRLGA